jgi:hypothetical protein
MIRLCANHARIPRCVHGRLCATPRAQFVIPEAERSEAIGNPVLQGGGYWIPRSPLRGAGE